jgi:hypothetical protein
MGYPLPRDEVRKLQLSPPVNAKMAEQPQQRIGLVLTVCQSFATSIASREFGSELSNFCP